MNMLIDPKTGLPISSYDFWDGYCKYSPIDILNVDMQRIKDYTINNKDASKMAILYYQHEVERAAIVKDSITALIDTFKKRGIAIDANTPISDWGKLIANAIPDSNAYVRNPEWLPLPDIKNEVGAMVGLTAVPKAGAEYCICITAYDTGGNCIRVDWGDGCIETPKGYLTAVGGRISSYILRHKILYENVSGNETSAGYKQTIVKISSGLPIQNIKLNNVYDDTLSGLYVSQWLDIAITAQGLENLIVGSDKTTYTSIPMLLEKFVLNGTNSIGTYNNMFKGCASLQDVEMYIRPDAVGTETMYDGCTKLITKATK